MAVQRIKYTNQTENSVPIAKSVALLSPYLFLCTALPRPVTLAYTLAPCLTLAEVGGNYSKHSSRMKENAENSSLGRRPFVTCSY